MSLLMIQVMLIGVCYATVEKELQITEEALADIVWKKGTT